MEFTLEELYTKRKDRLRVPFDYCTPSVRVTTETVECTDKNGNPNPSAGYDHSTKF